MLVCQNTILILVYGVFDLKSFIEELKHANEPLSSSHSLREESSNSETSSSNSQPSTVSNVAILEKEGEEKEEDRDSTSKKRKEAVKPVYIVQQICENEIQALAILKEAIGKVIVAQPGLN